MSDLFHSRQQFWCAVYLETLRQIPPDTSSAILYSSLSRGQVALRNADFALQKYTEKFNDLEPGEVRI